MRFRLAPRSMTLDDPETLIFPRILRYRTLNAFARWRDCRAKPLNELSFLV